ncbi:HvfC family RiPP maturation protein [Facilibium subflavum]|uniref:HvfC family RiPP maturation protein n=1 Tax=Facilibium subflavum TaxID=2219058 RepID=UPI000E652FF2|nr:putative DNA-binding domain-containing protein [Facilibium subflavum]
MPSSKTLLQAQHKFTQNIRKQCIKHPIQGVTEERMQLYQKLVYNNIEGVIRRTFPITISILSQPQWHDLIKSFLAKYPAKSPFFCELSKQFVEYITGVENSMLAYPFLQELIHYEWLELAVEISQNVQQKTASLTLNDRLTLAPSAKLGVYQYPVHQISPDFLPEKPGDQPVFLLVYQDASFAVQFIQLNLISAYLAEILQQPQTLQQALNTIADNLQINYDATYVKNAQSLCLSWIKKNILIKV